MWLSCKWISHTPWSRCVELCPAPACSFTDCLLQFGCDVQVHGFVVNVYRSIPGVLDLQVLVKLLNAEPKYDMPCELDDDMVPALLAGGREKSCYGSVARGNGSAEGWCR